MVKIVLVSGLLAFSVTACAQVTGTDVFEPCDESCEEGGGGTGPTTTTGTGATTTASTGTGIVCSGGSFSVQVTVPVGMEIDAKTGADVDYGPFLTGTSALCIPAGPLELDAECANVEVPVSWGNALCPGTMTDCNFNLAQDVSFVVTGQCP